MSSMLQMLIVYHPFKGCLGLQTALKSKLILASRASRHLGTAEIKAVRERGGRGSRTSRHKSHFSLNAVYVP